MAQGAQDVWSLSIKWPNIYQIIGNQFFLLEYASSGTWLILGILMILMYTGRIGPVTLALVFAGKANPKTRLRELPGERVMVG